MKINFIYDILGPVCGIPNGTPSDNLHFFWNCNFNTYQGECLDTLKKYNKDLNYWDVSSLNTVLDETLCVSDILDINNDILYLYPLSTSGKYYESLGKFKNIKKSIFSLISKKAIDLINNNSNVYIYYEHIGEPDFDSDILKAIYDECISIKLNIEKLLIINGTNSNDLILEDFREKYGHFEKIKLLTYNWPLPFKSLELRGVFGIEENKDSETSTIADITHINNSKSKKALFLNRRLRYHRLLSLCLLADSNLLDNIMCSFDMEQNMYDNLEYMILNDTIQHNPIYISNSEIKNKILNGYSKLLKINKQVLDKDDLSIVHGYGMETKELYEQTYFSIVSETEFTKFRQSFTEKILKPIQHFHPFVVIGSPFLLKILKSYGFKTFDRWWDESYDNEEDDEVRFLKVMDTISNLININDNEWKSIIHDMKDVLIHNNELLLSFDEEKMKTIISKNLKRVIEYNTKYIL